MLSGFYTAASGMLMQQRQLNVLSNNIANTKTIGFKSERVLSTTFEETLITRQEKNQNEVIGSRNQIRLLEDVPSNFDPSYLIETQQPLDLALSSEGYFNIQSEDQTYLTRNGHFAIDAEGYLVLEGVGRVLGDKGPLKVSTSNFSVDEKGLVTNAKNRKIGTLLITQPKDSQQLIKYANGLFAVEEIADNTLSTSHKINQGFLENSNVDMNRELTQIMEAQRSLQSCSTILKGIDQMNNLTVNQIAKL
jgi:flagellar basal body rod protein FlgG